MSREIDWWITSWCHCLRLVTISEMIVSACKHRLITDSLNPEDSTHHVQWWSIGLKSLPMRRSHHHLLCTSPGAPPCSLPPEPPTGIFTTRTHYGNQTVCVYRNQSTGKPWQRVMTVQSLFVTFDLWNIYHGPAWEWGRHEVDLGVNPKISI